MQVLDGRVAVVTGGGSGIGEGIARAAAAAGMRVIVGDIEADAAEKAAEAVRAAGGEAHALACDVTQRADVEALADAAWSRFGGCHLLCNNAGVLVRGPLTETSDDDWRWVLEVNLGGVLHGIQVFVPRLIAQGAPAHIVNTASVGGLVPLEQTGVYCTSKYAVVGLSETLRMDLAPHGIGVSVLCPGGVATRIVEAERNRPGGAPAGSQPDPEFAAAMQADVVIEETGEKILHPHRVGEMVIESVRSDDAYILTHSSWKEATSERFRTLLAAFEDAEKRGR